MGAKIDSCLPENSAPRGASTRHEARPRAGSSRPSNLFLFASAFPSCRAICANQSGNLSGLRSAPLAALRRWRFVENGNEHRRYVLQEIFRFPVLEKRRVLLEFVRDLIDDETAARRERIIRF